MILFIGLRRVDFIGLTPYGCCMLPPLKYYIGHTFLNLLSCISLVVNRKRGRDLLRSWSFTGPSSNIFLRNIFYDVFGYTVLHLLLEIENREAQDRVFVSAVKRLKISCVVLSHMYFSPGNINPLAPELFFLILAHPVYKM